MEQLSLGQFCNGSNGSSQRTIVDDEFCLTRPQTRTIGFFSGSGENFVNFIEQQFIGRFPCCIILTIQMLTTKIIKIPTTSTNKTYCPCILEPPMVQPVPARADDLEENRAQGGQVAVSGMRSTLRSASPSL